MGHYFINDFELEKHPNNYKTMILDHKFNFNTDNGVFSKHGLDYGTRLLIENLPFNELHGNVLDIGCGYGPIGITIAKLSNTFVHMVDINIRALQLARQNASMNEVKNILVYNSDAYKGIQLKYNYIVTNPPIRAGKELLYEIIMGAKNYLTDDGELWFVIRKQQGAESLIRNISTLYNVAIIDKSKGYYIVKAKQN